MARTGNRAVAAAIVASIGVVSQVGVASRAQAEPRVQLSTGADFSSGKYDETTNTDVLVVPFSARVAVGAWSIRASVPFVSLRGPADVSEIIDDGGGSRGSGSGSGGSGSSGSGSSGSGGSGSGSGGSGNGGGDDGGGAEGGQTFSDNRSVSGIGDASLSVTYSFDSIANTSAYVDVTGRVRLPTGNEREGLGVGATDYAALTELGWDGRAGGVFVAGGRRFLGSTSDVQRVDGWQASAGAWVNAGRSTVFGAYYDWRDASVDGAEDPSSVEAYATFRISDSWKVELSGGVGLADSSADYHGGISFIWRRTRDRH